VAEREPVGIIGVGLLGTALATRLSQAGIRLVGYDPDPAATARVRGLGGDAVGSPEEVARTCSRIFFSLPAPPQVLETVDQIEPEFHAGSRQLQRIFSEYVGIGPKWVIQRYRLLDAADRVASGKVVDWASLALDLGFADQAHFIRDFKKLVGCAPAAYARKLERPGRGRLRRSP